MSKIAAIFVFAVALFAADTLRRAPGFALPDEKGDLHDLYDYRGKVVLLEFMQTTCPHCAAFAAALGNVQKNYAGKLQVLSAVFPPDTPKMVNEYIAAHKLAYPVLFDCGQMAYSYIRKPTVDFPRLFLIDRDGMIRADWDNTTVTSANFESAKLIPEIDRVLAAPAKK
ncbi:MAG TPA: TlpA disulfide reductase family protein [Bryobacteraceae bacterium]|jgi:peroxiredoxin